MTNHNRPRPASKFKDNQELTKLIHIDPSLHKRLKGYCADNGKSMKEVTERIIREFLSSKPRIS